MLAIIDVYLRLIVCFHIGLSCKGSDLAFTLDEAVKAYGADINTLVIRSDNGTQMTSKAFSAYFMGKEESIAHEFIPFKDPNKNAHIESFNSIVELELFQDEHFLSYSKGYEALVDFIDFYNTRRIHGSLKYRTPYEVYKLHKQGVKDLSVKDIKL